MSEQGYLVISDITGYTAFLSRSELEHAEDSLRDLLNLLLDHTKPPLVLSRLEGDAVISYAPQGSFLQGQTLVETLESTYVAFRQALERMVLNTTCACQACRNIPSLDLKFFVHYGTFMLQQLGAHVELVGSDVNLIHRLTKNSIIEKTGFKAYSVYTQAAVDALGIEGMCGGMTPHSESYEHLGDVATHVQDMGAVWDRERERVRSFVAPDDALLVIEHDFPIGQSLLWDCLTKPEYRAIVLGNDPHKVGRSDGRIGPGSVYYCAHGTSTGTQTIVDWQPLREFTFEDSFLGATARTTLRLTPRVDGTRLSYLCGKSKGNLFGSIVYDLVERLFVPRTVRKGCRELQALIEEEIAEGKVVQPTLVNIPSDNVEQAVEKSLAYNASSSRSAAG